MSTSINEGNRLTVQEVFELKDVAVIHYIWWAMQPQDRKWWCAIYNGNTLDYNTKDQLKKMCEEKNLSWVVARFHKKNKGVTITERSKYNNNQTLQK
jgi:hypothetical protein